MNLRKTTVLCGALGLACAIAMAAVHDDAAPSAHAADIALPQVPRAVLVATHPGAELTSVFFVDVHEPSPLAPVSTFGHLPDATVQAVIVPGKTDVVVTADVTPTRDASFNAGLFYLRAHKPPERLVDGVVHASRPLVTSQGRVFVSRGKPGPDLEKAMRVDSLTIDEVNVNTGQTRTVHRMDGYLSYLAGWFDHELILYRIFPGRADIVAVDPDTGHERMVKKNFPPYARDFSVDSTTGMLVFQNRDEQDPRTWVVDRLNLKDGTTQRLFSSGSMSLSPYVVPGKGILYNPPGHGLSSLEGQIPINGPLGSGVDVIAAVSAQGRVLAGLHTQPSSFAVPFVVDTQSGAARVLPAPANTRVVVAGFVADGGAL